MHKYSIDFITVKQGEDVIYYTEEIIASNKIDAINKLLIMINYQKDSLETIISIERIY